MNDVLLHFWLHVKLKDLQNISPNISSPLPHSAPDTDFLGMMRWWQGHRVRRNSEKEPTDFLAWWGQETVCFTCCHSLTPNSAEHMIDTLYLLNKFINKWGNKWTGERLRWCLYLLEMNPTGPCRPDNLGSIFPQHPSKFSNSSTFFFCQAGYKVQAICDVDLHPVALAKAKPLGGHFQHRGVDLHSMDAGLWEMIVDKEREAAPTQAYHQQCQWGLCNKE